MCRYNLRILVISKLKGFLIFIYIKQTLNDFPVAFDANKNDSDSCIFSPINPLVWTEVAIIRKDNYQL